MRPRSKRSSGRPTIADVARRAGVGTTTVSRSLRSPESVSQELRQKITVAITDLGYVPDRNARALAAARSDIVAVMIPSMTNYVFADIVRGLYEGLGDSPLQIQLGNTHYSPVEEERLLKHFLDQRPSAIVVPGIDQSPEARRLLEMADCPVVQLIETGPDPIDMIVGFSHLDGGRAATRHLIDSGFRNIGFLGARMDPRSQRRLEGYRQAMTEAGLYDPELVVTTTDRSSVSLGGKLLHDALDRVPDLDAVFCNNDDIALGVLFECGRSGIAVPGSLGIIGFHDMEMVAAAYPSISSIRTPRFDIGFRAMTMLREALAGHRDGPQVIDLGFELCPRASTARCEKA